MEHVGGSEREVAEQEAASAAIPVLALADTDISWDRLDKTRFHVVGAIFFTVRSAFSYPDLVVKTRMQSDDSRLGYTSEKTVLRHILRRDGIRGIYRGFWTSAIGSLPGRVFLYSVLEISKDTVMKHIQGFGMSDVTRVAIANGVAGMVASLAASVYFMPLDVVCQTLMVQGLRGFIPCSGPCDVVLKLVKAEGVCGLYEGFGLSAVTQSLSSSIWWGAYGAAQNIIWRSLGFKDDQLKKPSNLEMITVQSAAGLIAGVCSFVITTPVENVKTRHQVIKYYGVGSSSVMKTVKTIIIEDGWRGFYRGFGPRLLTMSLYGTTVIVMYELIKRLSLKRE